MGVGCRAVGGQAGVEGRDERKEHHSSRVQNAGASWRGAWSSETAQCILAIGACEVGMKKPTHCNELGNESERDSIGK